MKKAERGTERRPLPEETNEGRVPGRLLEGAGATAVPRLLTPSVVLQEGCSIPTSTAESRTPKPNGPARAPSPAR